MNKYVYIENSVVVTIEDEYIDIFPDIHISKRFSAEFLNKCVIVDETVDVRPGMIYEDGVFKDPPEPDPSDIPPIVEPGQPTPTEVDILKAQIRASADRQEFIEELIAEMAMIVYD